MILLSLIIITGVTISAVIMFVHANDEILPGDTVLYASQLIYQTGNTENTFNSFVKN
jgi:hypothetical protein